MSESGHVAHPPVIGKNRALCLLPDQSLWVIFACNGRDCEDQLGISDHVSNNGRRHRSARTGVRMEINEKEFYSDFGVL